MTWNGNHTTFKNRDDWGGYYGFTHITFHNVLLRKTKVKVYIYQIISL